jgi:hypothetical protein
MDQSALTARHWTLPVGGSNPKSIFKISPGIGYTWEDAQAFEVMPPPKPVDLNTAIKAFAPRIYLTKGEEFLPSSIEYFTTVATIVPSANRFHANDELDDPGDSNWNGSKGQNPTTTPVPVYAFVVEGKTENTACPTGLNETFTDVYYFAFFPYNRGKRICIGSYSDLTGCVGDYTVFGNHVGDWEHVTVRLRGDAQTGYLPVWVSADAHGSTQHRRWSHVAKTDDDHPIVYAALGSHGIYFSPGIVKYKRVGAFEYLSDNTSAGTAWDTWNQIVTVRGTKDSWACSVNPSLCDVLLSKSGGFRWGNGKNGCGGGLEVYDALAGECRLNDGPTGPNEKGLTNLNACD